MIAFLIGIAIAHPYMDLHRELEEDALYRIQKLSGSDAYVLAEDFSNTIYPSARLFYEIGLVHNRKGELAAAMKCYERSLQIDPHFQPSLYDQAEIFLLQSNIVDAKRNLLDISKQAVHHWVVDYRLAQIFATEANVGKMEFHLKKAIQQGLPQQILKEDQAQWVPRLKDESVALTLEMFLQALGATDVWDLWTNPKK